MIQNADVLGLDIDRMQLSNKFLFLAACRPEKPKDEKKVLSGSPIGVRSCHPFSHPMLDLKSIP